MKHLVERYGLSPQAERQLDALLDALADPRAPTTVHDRERAIDVHVADSLSGLAVPGLRHARVIADVGSGAGLPGLVLAAALPSARVVLIESVARKCRFLRGAVARMGVDNVEIVCDRVESWSAGAGACDAVTARAVAALPVLCEYAAPLLRVGGVLVAWKGTVSEVEAADGAAAAAQLGLSEPQILEVSPFAGSREHRLYVFRKVAPTPAGYPRRPGIAAKRPLSAATQPRGRANVAQER